MYLVKQKTLVPLIFILLISWSCREQLEIVDSASNPDALSQLVAPQGFNFESTNEVSINVSTRLPNDASWANIPVQIYVGNPEQGGKLLSSGITNGAGQFEVNLSLPSYLDSIYVSTKQIGLPNTLGFEISPILDITIGGSQDSPRAGKSGSDISYGVAKANGFTYMGTYNSQGVPDYLIANDVFDELFLTDVNYTLPERAPVPTYHPEYLAVGNTTDIKVTEEADVWVTFVHEGAGWRNSLGYYTYDLNNPPQTEEDIAELNIIFPNVSLSGSGGGLVAGNKVFLGRFPANTGIGWFLVAQGWKGSSQTVTNSLYTIYSDSDFNPESNASDRQHNVLIRDSQRQLVLLGFEDVRRDWSSCDQDFNDAIFYVTANPFDAINNDDMPESTNTGADTDEDGIADVSEDYPNDPNKAFDNFFPAQGTHGTLAFEDLWPAKGDYDFNDLVVNYQFKAITNAQNQVTELQGQFVSRASGATYQNGFGFELPVAASSVASVSGSELTENIITLAGNGVESGQTNAVVMVYDNIYNRMQRPAGSFINTERNSTVVENDTINITINFTTPIALADVQAFNPFIIVNKVRGQEVHLMNYTPTDLADLSLLGTLGDVSNANEGKYYQTSNGLPFAIHIPESFEYPLEKQAINTAYLRFVEWATSGGNVFTDWYLNRSGYRNEENIY